MEHHSNQQFSSFAYPHISKDNILFIHSYDSKHGWTKNIEKGFQEVLKGRESVNVFYEYFDAKRFPYRENQKGFYNYLSGKVLK